MSGRPKRNGLANAGPFALPQQDFRKGFARPSQVVGKTFASPSKHFYLRNTCLLLAKHLPTTCQTLAKYLPNSTTLHTTTSTTLCGYAATRTPPSTTPPPTATPPAPHSAPQTAPHCAARASPHCSASPLVWCYLRLVARRISPRCSPCRHVLPRPLPASERLNARSAINIYNQFVLFSLYTLPSSRMRGRVESKSGLRKLLVLSKQGVVMPLRSMMV